MQDPNKLKVYQEASKLSRDICKAIKNSKHHRLKEQLMASSTSIPSNLGEFAGMDSIPQKMEKLRTCIREANETEERLKTFHQVGELSAQLYKDYTERTIYVRKMLINLLKAVESQRSASK